jgi:hypothetical protein
VTERNDNSIGAVAISADEEARRLLKFKHNGSACLCSVVRWFGAVSGYPGLEWDNSGNQGLAAQAKPSILNASFGSALHHPTAVTTDYVGSQPSTTLLDVMHLVIR